MAENEKKTDEPVCALCGRPLVEEEWIDDEECGDVHTRCLDESPYSK